MHPSLTWLFAILLSLKTVSSARTGHLKEYLACLFVCLTRSVVLENNATISTDKNCT